MKIVIVDHIISQKSCLLAYIDSRSLLEYFIDITKEISAEGLRVSSPYIEDIQKIARKKDVHIEFIKPDEINPSDIILEGDCIYEKRALIKMIKKKNRDYSKAILWKVKTLEDIERASEVLKRERLYILSRCLMMRWGRGLARLFSFTPITPNQVSVLSLLMAIFAALCFGSGQYKFFILGTLFLIFCGSLDFADGQLARLKDRETEFGKWFDSIVGKLAGNIVFVGIAYGLFLKYSNPIFILSGYIIVVCNFTLDYMVLVGKMQVAEDNKSDETKKWLWKLKKANHVLYSWDVRYYLFAIFSLINELQIIFLFYTVYYVILCVHQVIKSYITIK